MKYYLIQSDTLRKIDEFDQTAYFFYINSVDFCKTFDTIVIREEI